MRIRYFSGFSQIFAFLSTFGSSCVLSAEHKAAALISLVNSVPHNRWSKKYLGFVDCVMHRHKHKHAHSEIESLTNTNIGCMRRNIRLPQKWAFVLFDRFVMRNHSSNNVSLPTSNVAVVSVCCVCFLSSSCATQHSSHVVATTATNAK